MEQPIPHATLEQLYVQDKRSMQEIANMLGCSVHKVQYWMDKHNISRRRWNEASYVKHNPNGDPFEIREFESEAQRRLFDVAIGLYIGEGTKSDQTISLANSNPDVIRTWLRFLREICRVEEQKISAYLNLFDDLDIEQTIAFWESVTQIPRSRFFKPTVRPTKGGSYQRKSRYGTLTVTVQNVKLAAHITTWCNQALGIM